MEESNTTAQQQRKMAAPLSTCTREEQRSIIRFLSSEGVKPTEIHRRMEVQYGDAYLSLQQVYEWTIFRFDFYDTSFQMDHTLERSTLTLDTAVANGRFYRLYHYYHFI